MVKSIGEITPAEHALVNGFVEYDEQRRMAVLLRFFGGQSLRTVQDEVGIPRKTIDDLVKKFTPVYEKFRADPLAA